MPNLFVHGRGGVSAERRLQPDRHGGALAYLVGGRDPIAISEKPGPARPCVTDSSSAALVACAVAGAGGMRCRRRGGHRQAGFQADRARTLSRRSPAIARPATRCRAAVTLSPAGARSKRRSARCSRPTSRPIRMTGIGAWTDDEFVNALTQGHRPRRHRASIRRCLIPTTPRSRATTRWRSAPISTPFRPVHNPVKAESIAVSVRHARSHDRSGTSCISRPGRFKPDADKSAEWNRGAYLAEGLGHCGLCHTPKNFLGAR